MKREDILSKMFEAEFCEPKDKADKERKLQEFLRQACEQTEKPLYVLQLAFLKVYPQYRAKRLGKEFPDLPFEIRGQ
jgi:16S rRNA U1498 N3-methylase RsmE